MKQYRLKKRKKKNLNNRSKYKFFLEKKSPENSDRTWLSNSRALSRDAGRLAAVESFISLNKACSLRQAGRHSNLECCEHFALSLCCGGFLLYPPRNLSYFKPGYKNFGRKSFLSCIFITKTLGGGKKRLVIL